MLEAHKVKWDCDQRDIANWVLRVLTAFVNENSQVFTGKKFKFTFSFGKYFGKTTAVRKGNVFEQIMVIDTVIEKL